MRRLSKKIRYLKKRRIRQPSAQIFKPSKSIFAKVASLKLVIGFFSISVVFGIFLFFSEKLEFFSIQTIEIFFDSKETRVAEEALFEDLNRLLYKKNIVLINLQGIKEEIKRQHLAVSDLVIRKKFPSRVSVSVKERLPLARIKSENSEGIESPVFLIDETGLIFASAHQESLPLIKTRESLTLSQTLDSGKIAFVLKILSVFDPGSISEVEFGEEDLLEIKIEDTLVVFSLRKEVQGQLDILKSILESYKIHNKALKKIDLRFERPVVSY